MIRRDLSAKALAASLHRTAAMEVEDARGERREREGGGGVGGVNSSASSCDTLLPLLPSHTCSVTLSFSHTKEGDRTKMAGVKATAHSKVVPGVEPNSAMLVLRQPPLCIWQAVLAYKSIHYIFTSDRIICCFFNINQWEYMQISISEKAPPYTAIKCFWFMNPLTLGQWINQIQAHEPLSTEQ